MYSNAYVWSRVLSYLEQNSPAAAGLTYFDDTDVLELNEEKLVIYTPSSFRKDVILNRYRDMIEEAMRDQFQTEITLEVLDDEDLPQYKFNQRKRAFVQFNSQYTFETFVVGSSNKHAFSAAEAVAEERTTAYNPLYLYGQSGLGKTHLLYAIANRVQQKHPDYNIVYIKGDQFINEFLEAVRSGKNFEFRDKYRNADLFLVDDIQFVTGKESIQEEFFNTFNTLYENHRQIVLTSDRVPSDMLILEDRLRTRFEWGLIVDIQPPDYETRWAITKNKAQSLGMELPDDVCDYIAENITNNVRQIEGTVKKIKAYHDLSNMPLDITNVSRAIKDMFKGKASTVPTPELIISEVSRFYSIDETVLRSTQKTRNTAEARQVSMYLIRKMTNLSLPDIAKVFGKNHTTVLHAIRRIDEEIRNTTNGLQDNIREITANINSRL
ncbi:MAG: chromosomal replication initiator protein DnaA [Oscillospiraceae bacterium]|nr:chromosomal replication initiator protein DnaA [Oscillospiraceae bacterium]